MIPETRQEIRRAVNEIKILRRNMFAIARFMQSEWSSLHLVSFLQLRDGLGDIVSLLDIRYKFVFDTLKERNMEYMWRQVGIEIFS